MSQPLQQAVDWASLTKTFIRPTCSFKSRLTYLQSPYPSRSLPSLSINFLSSSSSRSIFFWCSSSNVFNVSPLNVWKEASSS
jgi:hypothetical protein